MKGGGHGSDWYERGQSRLAKSLHDVGEEAEPMFWRGTYPYMSPTHQEVPYAFKCFAFAAALMNGYDQAIWLDSACIVNEPLTPVWDALDSVGYCLGDDGWKTGDWTNDHALEVMKLTREEAMEIPLMAGNIIAFDLRNFRSKKFIAKWIEYAERGAFNGSHDNHRHDISCGSVIAHRLDMKLTPEMVSYNKRPAIISASGM